MATNHASTDRTLLDAFVVALRTEREALLDQRTDDLANLADRKLACAQALEQHASPALAGMLRDTHARARRGEAPLEENAGVVYQLVREAAELNRVNGSLIAQQLGRIRLSLSRIEPVSAARQLYGRDGQGRFSGMGRSFGAY